MLPLRNKKPEKINRRDQSRKIRTEDDALFIVRVKIIRGGKLIEQLMTPQDLQRTGLNKLTAQELANLNEWLDPDLGGYGLVVIDSSSS
jgi:hypothetical protein